MSRVYSYQDINYNGFNYTTNLINIYNQIQYKLLKLHEFLWNNNNIDPVIIRLKLEHIEALIESYISIEQRIISPFYLAEPTIIYNLNNSHSIQIAFDQLITFEDNPCEYERGYIEVLCEKIDILLIEYQDRLAIIIELINSIIEGEEDTNHCPPPPCSQLINYNNSQQQ